MNHGNQLIRPEHRHMAAKMGSAFDFIAKTTPVYGAVIIQLEMGLHSVH